MRTKLMLSMFSLSAGFFVSAGLFSFLTITGVVKRIMIRTDTVAKCRWYEDALIAGVILGSLTWFYEFFIPGGKIFLGILGLFTGIFTGALVMSLAEVLNSFPVLEQKLRLRRYLSVFLVAAALGKTAGAMIYFLLNIG